jgi:hypothetical protein
MLGRCPKNPEHRAAAIMLQIAQRWTRLAEEQDALSSSAQSAQQQQQQQQVQPKDDKKE